MFDSTLAEPPLFADGGGIPFDFAFPSIAEMIRPELASVSDIDGTLSSAASLEDAHTRLVDEVWQAFMFARYAFKDLETERLELAFREAKILAASHLFGAEISPNVSVDPYGEFTFYHRSDAGYVDIGVRGEGELSYHIRNDVDPSATSYKDYDWSEFDVPQDLFRALQALRKHL